MNDFQSKVLEYIIEARGRMQRIEDDLEKHIEGVEQNRKRIEELERPRLVLKEIKKWAAWLITVSAAAGIIYKVLN